MSTGRERVRSFTILSGGRARPAPAPVRRSFLVAVDEDGGAGFLAKIQTAEDLGDAALGDAVLDVVADMLAEIAREDEDRDAR